MTTIAKAPVATGAALRPSHDLIARERTGGGRSNLYLIGEADRSTRPVRVAAGRTSVRINGRWHAFRGRRASFMQLLRIAFPNQPLATPEAATVTYRRGTSGGLSGILTPGDVVELVDGLVVNADATAAS